VASVGCWTFLGLADAVSTYELDKLMGRSMGWGEEIGIVAVNDVTFAFLTVITYRIALRFLVERDNWIRRSAFHAIGSLIFSTAHILIRGFVYPVWDPDIKGFAYPLFNPHTWHFDGHLILLKRLFAYNVVSDAFSIYLPIVLIAHAVSYYQQFRERELRTAQLETQLAQAHLQALKNQLQPHFLFNTLHSISALVLTDPHAADRMIVRLSDLLRMSLEDSGTQETTLAHEVEFALGYLEIEKVRFENRLQVVLEIAPETLDAQVPHLVLQPLVENAVRHGIAKRTSDGVVRIASRKQDQNLFLQVKDNGPGLDESERQRNGLGLAATRERLQTLYGKDQAVDMRNVREGGLEVIVQIPFRTVPRPVVYEVASERADPFIS
jgi:signal transduction histidine kinase